MVEARFQPTDALTFIEQQLPVSRLSKESYKERKANAGQTLTALGSYWKGRKPLILVRATLLGLLLPATNDAERDRAIFLKLLLMDEPGLRKRKAKAIPAVRARQLLPENLHHEAFDADSAGWARSLGRERRTELESLAFAAMGLDEKLTYCLRPEELPDTALDDIWPEVNAHLGTNAGSLPDLVRQLGLRCFGHTPKVGDPFCGGGSIPFEAARLGCEVYAADLNPIASLLTWGALNIVGGDDETRQPIAEAQKKIVAAVDRQIVELGFEHDAGPSDLKLPMNAPSRWPHGWRITRSGEVIAPEVRPYTVTCPVTGWRVPMIETQQIHEGTKTILDLRPDTFHCCYELLPRTGVSDKEWQRAASGTVVRETSDFWLVHQPDPHDEAVRVRIANRAKAYIYCLETRCPKTGWMVPLAPSWVISKNYHTIARLEPDAAARRFRIDIDTDATEDDIAAAQVAGTVKGRTLHYELDGREYATLLDAIRGDVELKSRYTSEERRRRDRERLDACRNRYSSTAGNELRRWGRDDILPRPDDIFQERLYCIQWSRPDGSFFYEGATAADEQRERTVGELVTARLREWQSAGLVPDAVIEPGAETSRLFRERGWTHWHHLFGPRHLLIGALVLQHTSGLQSQTLQMGSAIALCRALTWMSRLTRWNVGYEGDSGVAPSADTVKDVFYNQALNTFYNYGSRSFPTIEDGFAPVTKGFLIGARADVEVGSAADTNSRCDIWITDPPYADAIQYHEITEYFLAWLRRHPPRIDWVWDSRRDLAIKGKDEQFRDAMIAAYSAMTRNMPEDGVQVVMFTHQDVGVWADLAEILWASGLHVTAGWCIATETEKPFAAGNYVQGTVLLVVRKRQGEERGYLARLQRPVEEAVRAQLETMRSLEDKEQPNFGDADYQLAAYAAALKVLTRYAFIDGRPVAEQVVHGGEISDVRRLLDRARRLASDFLLPEGLARAIWDELGPEDRFYVKGLQLEELGENRLGAYQEMARGFGVEEYRPLLATTRANHVRLKTARELGRRNLKRAGSADRAEDAALDRFAGGIVRHALYGIREAGEASDLRSALNWFHASLPDYWQRQRTLIGVLEYLGKNRSPVRSAEADTAARLAGAVHNDRM
jgi:adenine-specific DNA methylase